MAERLIEYFSKRHILTNLMMLVVLFGGAIAWDMTNKEEMPAVTFERIRIAVTYPGAPAADVEHFIAKPIEEKVRGLDGVYRVTANCSVGQASVNVEMEQGYTELEEAITDIRNAVLDIKFPAEVIDDPEVRVFRTDKKAILDVALYNEAVPILDFNSRRELQKVAFALENRLLGLTAINSINKRGYLQEEIQIKVYPERLQKFEVPFNSIMREVRGNNIRQPAGTIETHGEPKVTLLSELDTVKELQDLVIQGGFDGRMIRLGEAADIEEGYEKNKSIIKINGYEGIMFNVVKNGSTGILDSLDITQKLVEDFKKNNLRDSPIKVVMLDDESIDVRNRLSLIAVNGSLGFLFILAALFLFLDKMSGIWVAMGIPFTLCFTMIASYFMGYTVNGTTLAAVIIVMGIVVDDAIVVAENINRRIRDGLTASRAAIEGTAFVLLPVIASITTTCVAFIPLMFFTGHFGRFISFIPPIIFFMLGASLFESLIILPGHLALGFEKSPPPKAGEHWFDRVETAYGRALTKILPFRSLVFAFLIASVGLGGWIVKTKMKFVMFPREETRDLVLSGSTPRGSTRYETAKMTSKIEDAIRPYLGKEVIGFRTEIAQGRRGGAVNENEFRMLIEIVSKEKREKSSNTLIKELETEIAKIHGFTKVQFRKTRWGSDSGSPLTLYVQQNDDTLRKKIAEELKEKIEAHPALAHAEIDEGMFIEEYRVSINREKIKRLSISASDVASTFRAALEGIILYDFSNGDEEVRVRLTTVDEAKGDIQKVLSIPVENGGNYLVPLGDVVSIAKVTSPSAIARRDMKRTITVDADMEKGTHVTPLEAAVDLENNVFPDILAKYPTTTLAFGGEVQDTRESKDNFRNASILALILIYGILAVLFDSTLKPIFIMLAIPLGIAGILIAFYAHGKVLFGFYAGVGALGLAGVVINDAIIMLVKLDEDYDSDTPASESFRKVADIAQTRLRAVVLTTVTTVAGVLPTAYGLGGYDSMLGEMMLALAWGMIFGTFSTLLLVPCLYSVGIDTARAVRKRKWVLAKIPASVAILFLLTVPSGAETLGMREFVQRAVSADTEFEEILIEGAKLRYQKDLRLPANDLVLSVRKDLSLYLARHEKDHDSVISLSKLFRMTGTSVGLGYGFTPAAHSANSSSEISVSLTVPIAENAFGRSTRLLDEIVGLETEVSRFQITEAYEDYMATVMTFYLDWHEAYENLQIGRSSYRENEKLLENIKSRRQSRIAKAIDVNKIDLQVLAKKETLVDLEEKYRRSLNLVKRVIHHTGSDELIPDLPDSPVISTGTFDSSYARFKEAGRTCRVLDLLEKRSTLSLAREADELLPSIDLSFALSREGERTDFKQREDKAVAGFALAWPIGDRNQQAEHRVAQIEERRARLTTRNTDHRLRARTLNLYQQIERDTDLVALAEKKIALADSILQDESENYTYAKASLNDYIDAVNRLDVNRFSQIRSKANLRRLSIEWLRITDSLVAKDPL